MAAHVCLKNEFTEDEKCLMSSNIVIIWPSLLLSRPAIPLLHSKNQYFRNNFHFSEVHRSTNAMGHMQSRRHVNFAWDPLRSYFDEPQKNYIHVWYLHFVFISFLFIVCEFFIKILQNKRQRDIINWRVCLSRSTAASMTWHQSNVALANQLFHLCMTSLTHNVA